MQTNETLFPEEEGSKSLLPSQENFDEEAEATPPPKYSLPKDHDLPVVTRELVGNAPAAFKEPTFFASVSAARRAFHVGVQ